jgi:uncharacterized protein involved in tolerance to divalent cations
MLAMINVSIYIDSQKNAVQLVKELMEEDLLAHASIDRDNHSFFKIEGKIQEQINYVITGQTKALLFNNILAYIEKKGITNAKVYSLPITQCNENFADSIRNQTQKI